MSVNLESVLKTIQEDKDKNLKPENIRYGTSCLGVKGTLKPVTLTGGDTVTSIYLQDESPVDPNGIWLNTNKTYDNIYVENSKYTDTYTFIYKQDNDSTDDMNKVQQITMPEKFLGSTYCQQGNIIHLFGYQYSASTVTKMLQHYMYNYETNEWTKLSNCPTPIGEGGAVWIGDYIYIFGTAHPDYRRYAYKYNTLDDSWERLSDITTNDSSSNNGFASSTAYDTACCYNLSDTNIIYIACYRFVVMYNISENSYTDLTNFNTYLATTSNALPITETGSSRLFEIYNDKIIFLSAINSYDPRDITIKSYNISTGNVSSITTGGRFRYGAPSYVSKFDDILIFFGGGNVNNYIVDLTSKTWTSLSASSSGSNGYILASSKQYPKVLINIDDITFILIFNGKSGGLDTIGILLSDKSYEFDANTLIIYSPDNGSTGAYRLALFKNEKLLNGCNLNTFLNDVNYYDAESKTLIKNISTYYGNGTDWIKIK